MWKVYKEHKGYIQGELISKHSSESAALKAAAKKIKFSFSEKQKRDNQITIWLDDQNHSPIGVIIKNKRG